LLIYRPPHTHASVAETCKPLIFISVSARFARRNLLEVMGIYQRFGSLRSPNKCLKPFHRVAPMLAKKNQGAGAAPRPPTKKYRIHFPYRRKKRVYQIPFGNLWTGAPAPVLYRRIFFLSLPFCLRAPLLRFPRRQGGPASAEQCARRAHCEAEAGPRAAENEGGAQGKRKRKEKDTPI